MFNKKTRNIALLGYAIFLSFIFFYVKDVLKHSDVKEVHEDTQKVEEIKPVEVTLIVNDKDTYNLRLSNKDTVSDFLDRLRDNGDIFFEKTLYTYGSEIEDVNHTIIPEGSSWKVFFGDTDITHEVGDIALIDGATYELRLITTQ